ncbi:MAG: hypothetical protein ACRELA_02455 [Candidatus Rokuibacteriota bacterium]
MRQRAPRNGGDGVEIHGTTSIAGFVFPHESGLGLLIQPVAERILDAFQAFGDEGQELRARKIGRVLLGTTLDRPWSQYFCCMTAANREFVRKHPVATKRALRALLKANTICALEPDRAARFLVEKGYARRYEFTLQMLKELPYTWRDRDPADTIRFYAPAPACGWNDQDDTGEDHRPRDRLAVPERAEAGTESLTT